MTSYATVEPFDLSKVSIDRGLLFSGETGAAEYQRHAITKSGISPRAFPGMSRALEAAIGQGVSIAPEPQMTGALGAAILACRRIPDYSSVPGN